MEKIMSTERKPGSRGVTSTFNGGLKKNESKFGNAPDSDPAEQKKGSTKTKSPSKGFKKRRK